VANSKYSDLFPYILSELPGVSSLQAEAQIRGAVIDLCRRAKVWTHEDDPTETIAGARTYDINAPTGSTLVEIKALYLESKELEADTEEQFPEAGTPRNYRQVTPDEVLLWPTPDAEYLFTMTLTLTPSRASTHFPGWIAERYHDAIVAGAKARLMAMPGQPWSNIQQAIFYRSMFDTEVAAAKGEADRSFVRAPLRTTTYY
jgi:hypothetical protein